MNLNELINQAEGRYSAKSLQYAWEQLGWVKTPQGLRKRNQSLFYDRKCIWQCHIGSPTLPPAFNTPEEFYTWLNLN